jgi:hypothetical protein
MCTFADFNTPNKLACRTAPQSIFQAQSASSKLSYGVWGITTAIFCSSFQIALQSGNIASQSVLLIADPQHIEIKRALFAPHAP